MFRNMDTTNVLPYDLYATSQRPVSSTRKNRNGTRIVWCTIESEQVVREIDLVSSSSPNQIGMKRLKEGFKCLFTDCVGEERARVTEDELDEAWVDQTHSLCPE